MYKSFLFQKKKNLEERNREAKRSKLKQVMENARLSEQAQRNAERDQQEFIEVAAYERMYSKVRTGPKCLLNDARTTYINSMASCWQNGTGTPIYYTTSEWTHIQYIAWAPSE